MDSTSTPPTSKHRNRARKASGFVEQRSLNVPLEREPWMPPPYDVQDIAAFRAFRDGRAEAYQQQIVLEWILQACGTYESPFRPGTDGARNSDFAAGKQFIGQQVVKLLNMPVKNDEQGEF